MKKLYSLIVAMDNQSICISGKLIFVTANSILLETTRIFNQFTSLNIYLDAVTHSDSSGVALLISWIRTANNTHKKIIFNDIPNQMLSIASASDVDKLLFMHINTADRFKY